MDFTLLSHQIAPLQGSAATSPLLQSPHKGIKKHIPCNVRVPRHFVLKVIYFGKNW